MEACVGAHHLSRKLASLGHDARLMPAHLLEAPDGYLYRGGGCNQY
jgi:transposase